MVSVPYEITLLSNTVKVADKNTEVSVPYEITLLSNIECNYYKPVNVSVPYEITLLSNEWHIHNELISSFSTL